MLVATVQIEGVVEANVTVSPDVAEPLMAYVAPPTTGLAGGADGDVMVCDAPPIVKICVTVAAAFQLLSPAWSARTLHDPAVTMLTTPPDTVHTAGVPEVKTTLSPEEAVAVGE